jgi:hypothetical protein
MSSKQDLLNFGQKRIRTSNNSALRGEETAMYGGIRPCGQRRVVEAERTVTAAPGDVLKIVAALASSEDEDALDKIRMALNEFERNGKLVIVNEPSDAI